MSNDRVFQKWDGLSQKGASSLSLKVCSKDQKNICKCCGRSNSWLRWVWWWWEIEPTDLWGHLQLWLYKSVILTKLSTYVIWSSSLKLFGILSHHPIPPNEEVNWIRRKWLAIPERENFFPWYFGNQNKTKQKIWEIWLLFKNLTEFEVTIWAQDRLKFSH